MFCIYCGVPNPDDASYCSACGKALALPPAHAHPLMDVPKQKQVPEPVTPLRPAPTANVIEAPRVEAVKITRIVSQAAVAEGPRPAREIAKKRYRVSWGSLVSACIVLLIFLYPLRNGGGICDAMRAEVIQQVPAAVEILAARYPVRVGVLRSVLNDQSMVDDIAKEYVRTTMQENQQNPGRLTCYLSYYVVMFAKDEFRTSIADLLEKQLKLK